LHKKLKTLTVEQLKILHFEILKHQGQEYLPLPKEKEKYLESAIKGINQTFGGKELYPTKCDKAIQLLIGIESAQAFPDGSKRVALAAFEMFMHLNKSKINDNITQKDKTKFMLLIANHKISKKNAVECCIHSLRV